MREKHVVIGEENYLDSIIGNLDDETVERLNEEHCNDEEESIPFKPII